jgi:hypothetical protein
MAGVPHESAFLSLHPSSRAADNTALWRLVQSRPGQAPAESPGQPTAMEHGVCLIVSLHEAPSRTLHNAPIVRSSPLSLPVRTMLESREFGRAHDAVPLNLDPLADSLPGLECPEGDVPFLACDRSLEELSRSVDGLLQHRRRLLEPSVDARRPRRHVLVLGAGPGGLMTAIQLRLRGHHVVVCEQRDVYARNRYVGVYKEAVHILAALGMPESMTYDPRYRGKRGIMLADIQTLLHAIALKVGAVIYMGGVARSLGAASVSRGEVELQRALRGTVDPLGHSSTGMLRWHHDTVARVRSGVAIRFDAIVEATGGRSGLREELVGRENVVSLRTIARAAALRDPSLESFLSDPMDHSAQYVQSGYGCPPGMREPYAAALASGTEGEIPDALPCFVSNIDASVLTQAIRHVAGPSGLVARIGEQPLAIPRDWALLECRLADDSISRYHIEGPLPLTFEFGGRRIATREVLDRLNPLTLLVRILYAMGVPFDAVDRRRLVEFYSRESSHGDSSDIVSTFVGNFRGLRLGGERPIWRGTVPGNEAIEYGIVGEALQNAWYRFGVGVDDTFAASLRFAEGLDLAPDARLEAARRLEQVMIARSVQVLYHLYAVARNTEQGVVGPVLTEYYMDAQHGTDLAEARLREAAREGAEVLAAAVDVRAEGVDALLDAALDHARESCCRRALDLLGSLPYPAELLARAREPMRIGYADWRERAFAILEGTLSPVHREWLVPLFTSPEEQPNRAAAGRTRGERLAELGLGRYAWATPWMRACALRALLPATPGARDALERAAGDDDPLVAETAAALLRAGAGEVVEGGDAGNCLTIDKVIVLRQVSLFRAIPHEVLAGVAGLLTEQWAEPLERIFEKGELGDRLYVIVSGRVRVHDGERTLKVLERNDVFGELSLLDARLRAAAATAMERTHLLLLAQSDFYALMSERPEVTQAITRVLCGMVRSANALASGAGPATASAD